ncbi:hypothetical protein EPUS_09261 [Endocarpon pusillum Z07020]|uniref:Uncharacterized protein n=1 Tax=Endocarpon pusillum (strain Z07020 / HMAS-L-300199) TaxID=1263415 RepID=U1GLC7_ENDPU|nr:uncharacterized protein EPUS_09261 [Endocarpon pusillum Z07020]ERF72671.1 hypothetical protein EPUS_09261 [Endocarpon pusillum Z07020]
MTGVGEASAILTVAEAGFSLASKLKDLLDDYKSATNVIQSLRQELQTTSSSLENLGKLAEQNGLQNQNGVSDTRALTARCQKTISEIENLLRLESAPLSSALDSPGREMTRSDRMKWAFSKPKVKVLRAELAAVKLDIMLLYFTLMTFIAHTKSDQQHFKNKIPAVRKELQWANAKYEEMLSWAKRAEEKASKSTRRKEPFRKPSFRESDKRGMEGYLAYLTQRDAARRERRRQEALAFRQQQEEQKRKNDEEKERKIRDAAVLEYKSQKKEEEKKAEEARQQSEDLLQKLLTKAGVEEDKVGLILKDLASTAHPPIVSLKKAEPLIQSQPETDNHPIPAAVGIRGSVLSRLFRPRTDIPSDQNTKSVFLEPVRSGANHKQVAEKPTVLESWIIKQSSDTVFPVPISEELLSQLLGAQRGSERGPSLLRRYALLEAFYQRAITNLCVGRDKRPGVYWELIYLNELGERKRTGLWRRVKEIACVHIVVRLEQAQSEEMMKETITAGQGTSKAGNGPTTSHEQMTDPSSEVPPLNSTKPLIEHVPEHMAGSDPDLPHKPKHENVRESVQRKPRHYSGRKSAFGGPLLADIVERIIVDSSGVKGMKKVTTEVFKDAIDTRVVHESGYNFIEEDGTILIPEALNESELNKMYEWSKSIRRMDSQASGWDHVKYGDNRAVRSPHITWDIPYSRSANTDDLAYQYRPRNENQVTFNEPVKRTLSQPGGTGFIVRRSGSWDDPSSRYSLAAKSPYYDSTGKELVKYKSPNTGVKDFARNDERARSLRRQQDFEFAQNSSSMGYPTRGGNDSRGIILPNERYESPEEYTDPDWDRLAYQPRSTRRGTRSLANSAKRHYENSTQDDGPNTGHARSRHRGRLNESAHETHRPRSRERRRPMEYSLAENMRTGHDHSHMRARYNRTEVSAEREDDLSDSSAYDSTSDPGEREREDITLRFRKRSDTLESDTESTDNEDVMSPDKIIRSQDTMFDKGRIGIPVARFDSVIQLTDSEIIEQQLARYRDNQSAEATVDELAGTTAGDSLHNLDGAVLPTQFKAASVEDISAAVLPGPDILPGHIGDSAV